jgi:hypothetical protein
MVRPGHAKTCNGEAMTYIVKMEQVWTSYKEVHGNDPMDALKEATKLYYMHPDRFTWKRGEVYAKDVDTVDE